MLIGQKFPVVYQHQVIPMRCWRSSAGVQKRGVLWQTYYNLKRQSRGKIGVSHKELPQTLRPSKVQLDSLTRNRVYLELLLCLKLFLFRSVWIKIKCFVSFSLTEKSCTKFCCRAWMFEEKNTIYNISQRNRNSENFIFYQEIVNEKFLTYRAWSLQCSKHWTLWKCYKYPKLLPQSLL